MTNYRKYNMSSRAYALQPEPEIDYEYIQTKKRQKRMRQKRLEKETKRYGIAVAVHRLKLIASIFIVVAGSFVFVNSGAQITRQKRPLHRGRKKEKRISNRLVTGGRSALTHWKQPLMPAIWRGKARFQSRN